MLEINRHGTDGVVEIIPKRFSDTRGYFSEVYNREGLREAGIETEFVQDNHSLSANAGVLRGLHYQIPPLAQDKLIRVTHGRIFDVAVDIRGASPNYLKWVGIEISAEKWNQVLIPKGYAHGFVTLDPNTEVLYKVSAVYSPEHERSIRYDDPDIAIAWPMPENDMTLSEKDRSAPFVRKMAAAF